MLAVPTQWLLRVLVLVMALTAPLQSIASLHNSMPVCPAAGAHSEKVDGHHQDAAGQHCEHGVDQLAAGMSDHEQCSSACLGTCGACAHHCPAGVPQFSSAVDTPRHHLVPALQPRPGDVPPEASLRPPRLFS